MIPLHTQKQMSTSDTKGRFMLYNKCFQTVFFGLAMEKTLRMRANLVLHKYVWLPAPPLLKSSAQALRGVSVGASGTVYHTVDEAVSNRGDILYYCSNIICV